ncbi:MAG TPA: DNA recombination protein RmuC [Solirubrobacteraceae bacterium]|nr:DNA recombination protein RmuC [Solirubrobacteraceae bacterium]
MSALWLLVGVIVGAGVTVLIMRERIRALRQTQEQLQAGQAQLSDSFKAMSAEALDASMRQLTELARTQLQSTQTEAKGELERRQLAVEQLVRPLRDQLQRVDQQLLALNQERHQSQGMLAERMRQLAEANEKLRSETGALVTALRKPNTRGQWGQMQLRKVVELAGMVRHCDFNEQASFAGEEQTLRPDMVVNLPGGKHVIVDAKAPLQGILDAYEAPDEPARVEALQAHARLLRRHVKQLADKAYWQGMESAPDFVVLFLPGEHLYGAALDADPTLIEDAMARRVLIATPTTLLALLHSVGYGWQQERVAESAQAISDLGRELHGRLAKLSALIQTLGKRLNSTVNAYNETVGSYERRVLPAARRFAGHGAVAGGSELVDAEQITEIARDVALSAEDERAAVLVDELDRPRALFEDPAASRPGRHLRAADLRAADG